jgi:hypothetical protein
MEAAVTDFPILRESLASEYASAPREQLESIVQTIYGPGVAPEDIEGFFDTLGNGFKQAAGAVSHFGGQALPGIIQGASAGSALGPYGMLAGAIAGGAGGILSHSSNPTARAIGGGINTATGLVSAVRGGGAGGATGALGSIAGLASGGSRPPAGNPFGALTGALGGGGSGGSANALLSLLGRPETLQALLAGAMGQFGRQQVPVGGQQVPVHSMLSALGTVAQRASHEAAELDERAAEATPEYVTMAGEALGLDVDDAEGRTDALLTLLALSPSLWGSQNRPPVTVNVEPPVAPPPRAEPIFVAASGEDYEFETWEGDEAWPELDEYAWDQGGLYV